MSFSEVSLKLDGLAYINEFNEETLAETDKSNPLFLGKDSVSKYQIGQIYHH